MAGALERIFRFSERGTNLRTELIAGSTTFLTMSYIIVVNPAILSDAGLPPSGVVFATCLSAAAATLLMGIWANYPIALAPGMGLNAFFAYTAVPLILAQLDPSATREDAWRIALGAVFLSGVLFLLLSLFRLRSLLLRAIPPALKTAIGAGIGAFIAFIGFQKGNWIRPHPEAFLALGDLASPEALLASLGLVLMVWLHARGFRGAILFTILAVTAVSLPLGLAELPAAPLAWPDVESTLLRLDIPGALQFELWQVILVFLFVDLFDTVGTLVGVGKQGNLLDARGDLPRSQRAFLSDAVGSIVGACTGTSTVTSYMESTAGIAAGGRTGLANVVVAGFFLAAVFASPIAAMVPAFATGSALVLVGCLMMSGVREIPWRDPAEALPAFLIIFGMPFTNSIADGLAIGIITHTVLKVLKGESRQVHPLVYGLTLCFALRFAFLVK